MADVYVEILVEPFRENAPGPHVRAVVAALERAGLEPDLGPFATSVRGDAETIAAALSDVVRSGVAAGASSIQFRVVVDDA